MNESIKKFMEKAAQDPELAAKMSAIQDPDEAYRLASSVQDGFTREEFITAMEELKTVNNDLTDADLKQFAGGDDLSSALLTAGSVVTFAAAAI